MTFRLAAARLIASPLFTAFAVLSLALGVAVTTAVYSVIDALFLRTLGIHEPETMVFVVASRSGEYTRALVSDLDFRDVRESQTSFTALSATTTISAAVSSPSTTGVLTIEAVDGDYFPTLGIGAALGRVVQRADDESAARVAVLSHALWQSQFGASPAVIGQTLRIGGEPFEIVGVAPSSFTGLSPGPIGARLWIPLAAEARLPAANSPSDRSPRDRRRLHVFGRLADSATVPGAASELAAIGARLDVSFPGKLLAPNVRLSERGWGARTVTALEEQHDWARRFGLTLLALVSLVLVVACTNLANLMLARGTGRQKELAVRAALGASRWRLVREQCVESVLLASGGAVAAYVTFQALQAWMSVDFNLMGRLTVSIRPVLDPAATGVALVALLLALAVFGLEPAVHLARTVNITGAMAAGTARSRTRRQRMIIRWQVAVSAGFFIIATMFVRQTLSLARHDPGIDLDRIAVAMVNVQGTLWDSGRLRRALERVVDEARSDPSLEAIALSTGLPFGTPTLQVPVLKAGESSARENRAVSAIAATPSIFQTLGVELLRGRAFDVRDDAGAAPVLVVSELTARRLFGTVDAVGQQVILNRRSAQPQMATVIGVARDTDVRSLFSEPRPLMYLPLAQQNDASPTVVARSATDAKRAVPALREALRRADPDLPIEVFGTGYAVLAGPYEIASAAGRATLYLGGMTLLLAMAGLFGVQSHLITHRTREIGVRMSIGATARQIKAMVLIDGYRPVVEGLVLGLWGGFAGRVIVKSYLEIDVNIVDPWMLIVTPIPVVLAAFCACYLPARRAASVDPTIALRCE